MGFVGCIKWLKSANRRILSFHRSLRKGAELLCIGTSRPSALAASHGRRIIALSRAAQYADIAVKVALPRSTSAIGSDRMPRGEDSVTFPSDPLFAMARVNFVGLPWLPCVWCLVDGSDVFVTILHASGFPIRHPNTEDGPKENRRIGAASERNHTIKKAQSGL